MKTRTILVSTRALARKSGLVWGFSLLYVFGSLLAQYLNDAFRQGPLTLECLALFTYLIPMLAELGIALSLYHAARGGRSGLGNVFSTMKAFSIRWLFIQAMIGAIELFPYRWLRNGAISPLTILHPKTALTYLLANASGMLFMFLGYYVFLSAIDGDLPLLPGALAKGTGSWARSLWTTLQLSMLVGSIELMALVLVVVVPVILLPDELMNAVVGYVSGASQFQFLSFSWMFLKMPFLVALPISTYYAGKGQMDG